MSSEQRESFVLNPAAVVAVLVAARRRDMLRTSMSARIGKDVPVDVLRSMVEILENGTGGALPGSVPDEHLEVLHEIGMIVHKDSVPANVDFAAELIPNYLPLLPERWQSGGSLACTSSVNLTLNPVIYEQTDENMPPEVAAYATWADPFRKKFPILWVGDALMNQFTPFWLSEAARQGLNSLCARPIEDGDLKDEFLRALLAAGVLVGADHAERMAQERVRTLESARRSIANAGYAQLPDVVNPMFLACLRAYVRELHRHGFFSEGDDHYPLRRVIHNEPVAKTLHGGLARLVSAIVGEDLKPSFCYVCEYLPGGDLTRHTDRAQCVWNISLALDGEPELGRADGWPLFIENGDAKHAVRLGLGDGVLYRGTKSPHWRDPQQAGHSSTWGFFHFVPAEFSGALD